MTQRFYTNERLEQGLREGDLTQFDPYTYHHPLDNLGATSLPPAIGAKTLGVTHAVATHVPVGPDEAPPAQTSRISAAYIAAAALGALLLYPMAA